MEFNLHLPCFVVLKNTRLAILYYALQLCIFGTVAIWFYKLKFYEDDVNLTGRYQISFWIVGLKQDRPSWHEIASTALCAAPEKYEFWWDDKFKYNASECRPVCSVSHSTHECIRVDRAFFTERANEGLFLTSLFRSRGGNQNIEAFIPEVLDIEFGFTFALFANRPSPLGFVSDHKTDVSLNLEGENANIFFVILRNTQVNSNAKGSHRTIQEANRSIATTYPGVFVLSIREVLELAGVESDLTLEVHQKTRNAKIDGITYPTLGVSGLTISANFVCYDNLEEHGPINGVSGWDPTRHAFACTLMFIPFLTRWAESRHADAIGNNGYVERELVGFRIHFSGSGHIRYFSLGNAFVGLMSLSAFMVVPRLIMFCFCCYCLGPLSSIYSSAIRKSIDVDEEVASVSAQVGAKALVFEELRRMNDSNRRKRIYDAVEQDEDADCRLLFDREAFQKRLIFVISAYLKGTSLEAFVKYNENGDVDARKSSSQMIPGYIENIDASMGTQLVHMQSLCGLFDTHRCDRFYEFFFPRKVRNSRSSVKRGSSCKKDTRNSREMIHDSVSVSEENNRIESRCVIGRTADDTKSDQILTGELSPNRAWFEEIERSQRMFNHRIEQQLSEMKRTIETSTERMCDMATSSANVAAQCTSEFEQVHSRLCFLEARLENAKKGGSGIHGTPCSTCERCAFESTADPIKNDAFENLAAQFKHLREQLRSVRWVHSESLAAAASATPLFASKASVGQLNHFPPSECEGIASIDGRSRLTCFGSVEAGVRSSSASERVDVARERSLSKPRIQNVAVSIRGNPHGQ